ncbi:MAG TPA: sigma-70 family RNA polymerase sigma factor [Bacillales bacterium]
MEEERLIQRAKDGDLEAFRELVERFLPVVERFAYQIGSPPAQIEDVAQEVFLRVYRFLNTYSSGKFSTWLYRITLNISRDMMRKNKREHDKVQKLYEQPAPPRPPEVEKQLLKNDEYRHLHNLIIGLDEKYRVPLVLFYFQEKKYDEIAEILSIPLATVKTRISRARRKLKELLEMTAGGEDDGLS